MIRYAYTLFSLIPAPFVHVTLRCPETGTQVDDVAAQIDTAADRTILPARLAEEMGLAQMGRISLIGFGGRVAECPTYSVEISIRTLRFVPVKVGASDGEPHVLLGRDVLNHYHLVMDGPKLVLEIS